MAKDFKTFSKYLKNLLILFPETGRVIQYLIQARGISPQRLFSKVRADLVYIPLILIPSHNCMG